MARSIAGTVLGHLSFFAAGLRRLDRTASLVPSSRFLVDALLRDLPLEDAHCVVELGPGLGTVTHALLARLPPDAHVHAIELEPSMIRAMRRDIDDPRLHAIPGSAADTVSLVRQDGCHLGADVVVSSLGLSSMPTRLRDRILKAISRTLAPHGELAQYQYAFARLLAWQPDEGFHGFDARAFLASAFGTVDERFVLANLPPALVYTCRDSRRPTMVRGEPRELAAR